MQNVAQEFLDQCISVDLEVDPRTARVFGLAAAFFDEAQPPILMNQRDLTASLARLDVALDAQNFLIGHNIRGHDLPHLAANLKNLARAATRHIDTLWLNPLAFPRNPYHHLVKHYHDGRLNAGHVNDPLLDARLVFTVLGNQLEALTALEKSAPEAVLLYHYLCSRDEYGAGYDAVFKLIRRGQAAPLHSEAMAALGRLLQGRACKAAVERLQQDIGQSRKAWPTAYALSWISVAGGDSVMPPWVRARFADAALIVRDLRDTQCDDQHCDWCRENNDPIKALSRWFGFDGFRPEPFDEMGRPLQERIVDEGMRGESLLGILPTGTGKSVCYQIPALAKFDRTGALSVVISPLVALMQDQVQGMARAGISSAVTINGMLSMPERKDALDRIRLGEAALLLISPEQLRSTSVRTVLTQREVGLWVLDEAHCVSKWGHDFRPDYRYVSRFIREFSGDAPAAPIIALTATAKPEVVRDICDHFRSRLDRDLMLLDGGASRTNLSYEVRETQKATKLADIFAVIEDKLPLEGRSGAVVYCATRGETERVAEFLTLQGMAAAHFHAGMTPEQKRDVQERFRIGDLRIIAATNAFGMGIDKPDIRLVVHGDIPGSLENYLQEAGRAGRDREHAHCVLLYLQDDVERQFNLAARSRLARHEIGAILKAVRRLDERSRKTGSVVATSGEIVRAELDQDFGRDSATDDTRVKTAIAWLEEATLLRREENRVQVYPSSLQIRALGEAETVLGKTQITGARRKQLLDILQHLMNAAPDVGISTDELCSVSGLTAGQMNKAMADLELMGLARNDTAVTVFVHIGGPAASSTRLKDAASLENDLIAAMRELAPDADVDMAMPLNLAETTQGLRDLGHIHVRPDIVEKLLQGMARDGQDLDGGKGNLRLRKLSRNALAVTLQRSWHILDKTADIRRQGASLLLAYLIDKVPPKSRGKDVQVETTIGDLMGVLMGDAFLKAQVRDVTRLLDRALLWLHEQEVITLGKGLTVFRPAMTIQLRAGTSGFTREHFLPLEEHYNEQTVQTHVMAAYAQKGLHAIEQAQRLSEDYFVLDKDAFMKRWMPGKAGEVRRQTTGTSWRAIVDALNNPVQQKIVSDDRDATNVLVLAGPGSGKTRVLVHRIAYLLRVRREDPRGILVLTYNRHAAAEIRARLRHLIGDDAFGVTISTCHSLAMRLVGVSFSNAPSETREFDKIVLQAVSLLNGEGLGKAEAEAQRDLLIEGYRWILVDEYQDIGPEEYALIAAVAGRSLEDPDLRLSLFAVGDDDQNIYAFAGASIRYIRQFEEDYRAKPEFLVENYRSSRNIIASANEVICLGQDRMKHSHDIVVNQARAKESLGGYWAALDPVAQGRVQVLRVAQTPMAQAVAAVDELVRLSRLDPDWSWTGTAIISRDWRGLGPVRAYAERLGIPVSMANESLPNLWRLREMQAFIAALKASGKQIFSIPDLLAELNAIAANKWTELIAEGVATLAREIADKAVHLPDVIEWFAEWARDARSEPRGVLLLTAHRAKGLEFRDVVILDGDWAKPSKDEDADGPRRLFYVAMTRAKSSLAILTTGAHPFAPSPSPSPAPVQGQGQGCLWRDIPPPLSDLAAAYPVYLSADMKLVDLSWAGRLPAPARELQDIASAKVGDPLTLDRDAEHWVLRNQAGKVIGRLAKSFAPPAGKTLAAAEVGAIVRWRKADNGERFQPYLKREDWEVVLPEFIFS